MVRKAVTEKFKNLRKAVLTGSRIKFRESLNKLHPRDRAEYLFSQSPTARKKYYGYLPPEEVAELFDNVDIYQSVTYVTEMKTPYAAKILDEMYEDDAVDILSRISPEKAKQYLALMDNETASRLAELLRYDEEHAGSIMTTEFISVREETTASEAIEKVKKEAEDAVTIYYVFVLSDDGKLLNVLSLKELLLADKNTPLGELEHDHIVSVRSNADKEEAAHIMKDYDFVALPVVDFHDRLLGVITIDDIVDFLHEEGADTYSKLAAVSDIEVTDPPLESAKKRLPWLILLLFLGMITATLIGQFEDTIAQVAILGAFIPVVAGTTGNSGTQSLAIVVRGLASGKLKHMQLRRYFIKEAGTAAVTSVVAGLVLLGIIFAWKGELAIGIVAGASLAFSIFVGTLSGSIVPLALKKVGIDPAVASGPLITTICDIISMAIYFGIATVMLGWIA